MKLLLPLFIAFSLLVMSANLVRAQSCTGYGVCCDQYSIACIRNSDNKNMGKLTCTNLNLGSPCLSGAGTCQCTYSYTRTCNDSCVSNECSSGDYLIEDYCYRPCYDIDQGCAAAGCPAGTRRLCDSCTGTCRCVTDPTCGGATPTPSPLPGIPSCTLTLPSTLSVIMGQGTKPLTAAVTNIKNGTVSKVNFSSNKVTVVSVNPTSDPSSPYQTDVSAVSPGNATVTASAIMGGVARCSDTTVVTVPTPSCTVSLAMTAPPLTIGSIKTLTATTTVQSGTIDKIDVVSANSGIVKVNTTPINMATFPYTTTVTGISNGTARVTATATMNSGATCSGYLDIAVPACTVNLLPATLTLPQGDKYNFTAGLSNITPSNVTFTPNNANISVNPPSDALSPYATEVTANLPGSSVLTASAFYNGLAKCSDTSNITISNRSAWWQVVDGDVQTNGSLNSDIPSGLYFGLKGLGGFPGVSKYGSSTTLTGTEASELHWLANSKYSAPNGFPNYSYFRRMVPDETTINKVAGTTFALNGSKSADGYYWYEYDAGVGGLPLSISSPIALADGTKVILLVTGANLNIEKKITYTSGKSIFVALVDGDINIDPSVGGSVYDLQGFFLADGTVSTGVSSSPLHVRGSVAALGGFNLQRNLASLNVTTPSEVFEYDPAGIFLFPPKLSVEKTRWKEVAP